jgi:hypothetical protein
MAGIIPEAVNGGVIIREQAGDCIDPTPDNVMFGYCPPPGFTVNCDVLALPSDCTARISAAQINALVSELMCLAVAMAPTGSWDCDGVCNLSANFETWVANNLTFDGQTIIGTGTAGDPLRVDIPAVIGLICASASMRNSLVSCLLSTDPDNVLVMDGSGRLLLTPNLIVSEVCNDPTAGDNLAACLISTDALNFLQQGTDGRLYVQEGVRSFASEDTTTASDVGMTQGAWQNVALPTSAFSGAAFGAMATPTFTFSAAGTYLVLTNVPMSNATNAGSNPQTATRLLLNGATGITLSANAPGGVSSGTAQFNGHSGHLIRDFAVNDTIVLQALAQNGSNGLIVRTPANLLSLRPRMMLIKLR